MNMVRQGYLPNYPYHMISDEEMCDAFIKVDGDNIVGFFVDTYPCPHTSLQYEYNKLVDGILGHINKLKTSYESDYSLPDWVYSYMLGIVIGSNSSIADIHDLLVLLGVDNLNDEFTPDAAYACYQVSSRWLSRISNDNESRPATMFGEPHVIKALRISQTDISK